MTVYVFAGPTLTKQQIRDVLNAIVLPPASQGDIYRVALKEPSAIGLIDGRFRDTPAIWHKEILWALHRGIAVFGSASTGALRAAELLPFGMRGFGKIFECYSNGDLEDDDEVAVATAGPESDFTATSEAMVNIRFTLAEAERARIISPSSHETLLSLAKSTFFPDRSYALLLREARGSGVPEQEVIALEHWLPTNRIDQKRADAVEMLHAMSRHLDAGEEEQRASFHFEHTQFFEQLRRSAGELLAAAPARVDSTTGRITLDDLLEELGLDECAYNDMRDRAALRCLAAREARSREMSVDIPDLEAATVDFRRVRGLHSAEDVDLWMSANHLRPMQLFALVKQELLLQRVMGMLASELPVHLRDELRLNGRYAALAERAQDKRRALGARGLDNPSSVMERPTPDELLRWYFIDQRRLQVPDDPRAYASSVGFADLALFVRALRREYWYSEIPGSRALNDIHNEASTLQPEHGPENSE